MERIVVEVNEVAAKKWRYSSFEKKQLLAKSIQILIDGAYSKNEDDFWVFVEKLNQKAAENGMTEEELGRLLNEG